MFIKLVVVRRAINFPYVMEVGDETYFEAEDTVRRYEQTKPAFVYAPHHPAVGRAPPAPRPSLLVASVQDTRRRDTSYSLGALPVMPLACCPRIVVCCGSSAIEVSWRRGNRLHEHLSMMACLRPIVYGRWR
jgi:hypothetical protein